MDSYFEFTCPSCGSKDIAKPTSPLQDGNRDEYALECADCGLQWQPGDNSWPMTHELAHQSIADVLVDWGQSPRRGARVEADRRRRNEERRDIEDNPPTIDEAFPPPWATHKKFPEYIVPRADVCKPVGGASNPLDDRGYARILLSVRATPSRGVTERTAGANAKLIVLAVDKWQEGIDAYAATRQKCWDRIVRPYTNRTESGDERLHDVRQLQRLGIKPAKVRVEEE